MPVEVNLPGRTRNNIKEILKRYNKKGKYVKCFINLSNKIAKLSHLFSCLKKDVKESADLTLVFVDNLNENTLGLSYYYQIAEGKTVILMKNEALFATENIAHEIGHVLGAGHGPDPGENIYLFLVQV